MSEPIDVSALMKRYRHIRYGDVCACCLGTGVLLYGNTVTWVGGIGGASMTYDVCDKCWGSGSAEQHWTDLRKQRNTYKQDVAKAALTSLCDHAGVKYRSARPHIEEMCLALEALPRKRKYQNVLGMDELVKSLVGQLRAGMVEAEVEENKND